MNYLKKELNKLLPFSLLFGAIGGVLLILVNNLMTPSVLTLSVVYVITIGLSVFLLNSMRYRRDTTSSILYGYMIFAIMTLISFIDTLMNTGNNFYNPMFEKFWVFVAISVGVLFLSGIVSLFSTKRTLS